MNNVITLDALRERGACDEQYDKFSELFGESVTVTRELALEHADVFDWHWAADEFLSEKADDMFRAASGAANEEYDEAIASHAKAYNVLRDAAWETYHAAYRTATQRDANRDMHSAVRRAAIQTAFAAYETAIAPFRVTYKRALAVAFVDAFLSPTNQGAE